MALPSDDQNADSRLAVTFYKRSVKQEDESIAAGRPIFKEFDFSGIEKNEDYRFSSEFFEQVKIVSDSLKGVKFE